MNSLNSDDTFRDNTTRTVAGKRKIKKFKSYPQVRGTVESFESKLVTKRNGFLSPQCQHCVQFCLDKDVSASSFESADQIH